MLEYKKLKKIISIVVVIAFVFNIQSGIQLHSQGLKEWENQFDKAKNAYTEGKYSESKKRIELIIRYNKEIKDRKELLGKCHLLLGAVHEKQGNEELAKKNYRKAKDEYGIESIDGIDLENLEIYRRIIMGEKKPERVDRIIEKPGKIKKKKFPWLLVVGGVAVVAVAAILLTKKKKKQEYTLTVNLGQGVQGTPPTGTNTYEQGTTINYNYTLGPGYNTLVVQLNGNGVSSSGTITMNQDHTLTASASTNVVNFVTDRETIEIPEGSTASFTVRLSAQPTADVSVTVARESGDADISVISGGSLTFTTENWNTDQTVTLQAAQDTDTDNGQATIAIDAPGIPQKNITAEEQDDDVINDLTVSIVEPKNGTQVTRGITVYIEAEASSSSGIQKVEFYVNNRFIKQDSRAPYRASWDTTGELHGNYTIRAIAYDNNGNQKQDEVTVNVLPL
jgi:hypothetical protein